MITDYHPYAIEQKLENDFFRDSTFIQRRERQIHENLDYLVNEDLTIGFLKFKKNFAKEIIYSFNNNFYIKIPFELRYLLKAYQKSEYIINLEDDWDDDGAKKYDYEVWKKSIFFLNEYSTNLFLDFNKKIEVPKIYHGPNGSIDILIENTNYSLLINVNKNDNKALYYGSDNFGNTSKGEINISKINCALIPIAFNF